jgi:hypothetical protein
LGVVGVVAKDRSDRCLAGTAALFCLASRAASVVVDCVAIITSFSAVPDEAVTADRVFTNIGAGVCVACVAIIALLRSLSKCVSTASVLASIGACIVVILIAIVALLARIDDTISANGHG